MLPLGMYRRHRVRVERQGTAGDDGAGNVLQTWEELVCRWASFRPQFGKEQLAAGRLEATTLGVLVLRRCRATAAITAADRMVFLIGPYTGAVAQIRSLLPTPDNTEIEFTLEIGVAT